MRACAAEHWASCPRDHVPNVAGAHGYCLGRRCIEERAALAPLPVRCVPKRDFRTSASWRSSLRHAAAKEGGTETEGCRRNSVPTRMTPLVPRPWILPYASAIGGQRSDGTVSRLLHVTDDAKGSPQKVPWGEVACRCPPPFVSVIAVDPLATAGEPTNYRARKFLPRRRHAGMRVLRPGFWVARTRAPSRAFTKVV